MGRYSRITTSSEETVTLGQQIGALLSPGDFVFCIGELGVGKTEFIRGISQGFCGKEVAHIVASPSFNYVNTYKFDNKIVHHFDLYRIKNYEQFLYLGFNELLLTKSVCCIEWPDLLQDILKENVLYIELKFSCDFSREVILDTCLFRKNIDLSHIGWN